MVQVSYPGVYVVEVPSGVHTITGVATSVGAFLGRAARGPMNKAVHVLSPSDYQRAFGAGHPQSDLAQSVQQFFDNGGNDCYVVRLAHNPVAADVTLRRLADDRNVLKVRAKSEGLWGSNLRLEIDYDTPNPDDTFNLRVYQEEAGTVVVQESHTNLSMNPTSPRFAPSFVSQSSTLVDVILHADIGDPGNPTDPAQFMNQSPNTPPGYSQSRRPFPTTLTGATGLQQVLTDLLSSTGHLEMSVNREQWVPVDLSGLDFTVGTPSANDISDEIEAAINTDLGAVVAGLQVACRWDALGAGANQQVLRITSASGDGSGVQVRMAQTNDLASPMMLGLDQGGIEVARYSNLRPVFTGSAYMGEATTLTAFTEGINELAGLQQDAINAITIGGIAVPVNLVTTAAGDRWYQGAGGSFDGVREKLQIIANTITNDATIPWEGLRWGYHLAFRSRVPGSVNDIGAVTSSGAPAPNGTRLGTGFTANVRRYALGNIGTGTFQSLAADASGPGTQGDDPAPTVADYLGSELLQTGLHALDSVDIFNLMVIPGDRELTQAQYLQIVGPASTFCENHRAFLLIDAPDAWTLNGRPVAQAGDVNSLRALVSKDHSAVFYPKVRFSDGGLIRSIGPSGMIAGLISRIDSTRGVWKAPAGVDAEVRGVLDVEVNLTDKENGVLNKLGANCIRKFPAGFVNWGARTLEGADDLGSEWKYIPVRRLALFLEESLFRGTKWVVFEPNDEPLWAQIRMNLNAFMMGLFRQGAFQGSTPDKAFYVKCDGETTTANDRNLGIVNIEVGFAPLKPAEFVVIKIQQIADLQAA